LVSMHVSLSGTGAAARDLLRRAAA